MKKLLLFDLDGTLLQTDKTISPRTLAALENSRKKGCLIGISTSRGERNCQDFLGVLKPDILISCGGALIRQKDHYIHKAVFSPERTNQLIATARAICGEESEITIDTLDAHFWNYKEDPLKRLKNWGRVTWTDYQDFHEECLKMCVEIFDEAKADALARALPDCDAARFSDGYWYKYTVKNATKEHAIAIVCQQCHIDIQDVIAFGDDYADIGMLQMAGVGVAMGNAIAEVKQIADVIIGSNDQDGIAVFLENDKNYLHD